jgi:hypothetical protein
MIFSGSIRVLAPKKVFALHLILNFFLSHYPPFKKVWGWYHSHAI